MHDMEGIKKGYFHAFQEVRERGKKENWERSKERIEEASLKAKKSKNNT